MAGIIRLSNTGTGNGQSTITTAASGDTTYTLPSGGGTFVTTSSTQALTVPFASGTVSAPSVTFLGDSNTGIYSPAADTIAFTEGGVESLRIDSSGRVGIGTSSPSGTVHAYNAGGLTSVVIGGDAASSYSQVQLRNSSAKYNWSLSAQNNVDNGFEITPSTAAGGSTFSTPAVVVKSDGKVGIGITPAAQLDVKATSGTLFRCEYPGVAQLNIGNGGNSINYYDGDTQIFRSGGGTERARIDSSGRLLVGTSSARDNFYNTSGYSGLFQVEGANNDATRNAAITYGINAAFGPLFTLAKHRSNSVGGNTIVASNDQIGIISFQGADGSELVEGAQIAAFVDGTPGANDMPGRLVFSTTPDSGSSPVERVRITNAGRFNVVSTEAGIFAETTQGAGTSFVLFQGRHSATAGSVLSGTSSFQVFSNGNVQNTNNSYGAISDAKLKENIVDATSQWSDIKALQVRKYNFKEGQTHTQIGLVAQEVELVSPGLVSESPDRDAEGNDLGTVTKSVNYSVLYMKAVKALQEAMERIEQLESEMAEVKAQLS